MSKTKLATSTSPIQYIHIAISILFMFGFGYLPPFSTVTPLGMKLLGIFIGVIYAYSTCEIVWPSLLAIIAFALSGYTASFAQAVSLTMGSSLVFQIITQYFTTGAIVIYGVSKWLIRKTLSIKALHGKPQLYTWCLLFLTMWSCIVMETIPLFLLLYSIWNDIAENCGYEKDSSFRYFGFGGILLAEMLGVAMMPYKSWQLGLATSWANITGVKINLGQMFICTAIIGTFAISAYVYLGSKLFKVDFSKMEVFDVEKLGEESKRLRPRCRRILAVYLLTVVLALFAGTFRNNPVADFLNTTLTVAGLFCVCTAVLMILPSGEGDGKPAIVFSDIKNTDAAVSWPVIWMVAVTIPLATAVTSEGTGISEWLKLVFTPVFGGRGGVLMMLLTILIMVFLTNVGSNIALGNLMIAVISPFVMSSGLNPMFFGCALIYACNIGIFLPGSSAPASIFHGRSEIPDARKRMKTAGFAILLYTLGACVVFTAAMLITN